MPSDAAPSRLDAITRDAIEHLKRGRADRAAPLVDEMEALLADRPDLARQMRRIVAVIGFEWKARREPLVLAAAPPPQPRDVELVAFHVAIEDGPAVDYAAHLAHLFESARLRAPASRRVLLTDFRTELPHLGDGIEVMRLPVDGARLMYERMRVQHAYLRTRPRAAATVFLDSDVVVNAEPSMIFSQAFDVGLTHREVVDAPFNGGVIFVAPGQGGLRFFEKGLACYEAMATDATIAPLFSKDLRAWWGDQFAWAALVGWRALAERGGDALAIDGLRVRIFPCETHNYTIEPRLYAPGELEAKHFVHFKGPRKAMMEAYMASLRGR